MKAGFPDATAVNAYLTGLGLTVPAGLTVADLILASIQEWEFAVGVAPWFVNSTSTATSKTVTPMGEVTIHIPPCADVTAVSIGSQTLVEGTDYWVKPDLAEANFRPVTYIEFEPRIIGWAQELTITGRWGYQTQVFESVYQLIMDLTVSKILEAAQMKAVLAQSLAASGPVTEVKQENLTIKYGGGGSSGSGGGFTSTVQNRMKELASMYRIKVV